MVYYSFHTRQYHVSNKVTLHLHVLSLRPILILFYHLHLSSHLSIHLIHGVTNFLPLTIVYMSYTMLGTFLV